MSLVLSTTLGVRNRTSTTSSTSSLLPEEETEVVVGDMLGTGMVAGEIETIKVVLLTTTTVLPPTPRVTTYRLTVSL